MSILVIEEPGATNNFIIQGLTQVMNLPIRPLSLKLKVFGGRQIIKDTREYSLNLRDMY